KANDQTVFRYCDSDGSCSPEFPVNPNGSVDNLAAVSNGEGNVLAMMPHPERTAGGDPIFTSMAEHIREGTRISASTLSFVPPPISLPDYHPSADSVELLVELIITDNEAVSVEGALRRLGVPATVSRQTHWEVTLESGDKNRYLDKIIATGELLNSNKEKLLSGRRKKTSLSFLVRDKDDSVGQQKLEILKQWFQMESILQVKKGVLWTVSPENGHIEDLGKKVLSTHILFNPYAHDTFVYG
ncbi:MAG: phosphoribosylformylglycinamidine synthase subunit PurQ, partial [Fidelibacterota bacterium]